MTTKRVKMANTESGRWPDFFQGTSQFHCLEGQEYDVPTKLADAWIGQGIAKAVRRKKEADEPASTTTTPKGVK